MARTPTPSSPSLMPTVKKTARQVFLDPELWVELTAAAEFHSTAFAKMTSAAAEKVSRNDIIEFFLKWALETYWDDKGGRPDPKSPEFEKKAGEFAERLKRQQSKK